MQRMVNEWDMEWDRKKTPTTNIVRCLQHKIAHYTQRVAPALKFLYRMKMKACTFKGA